jgi:hypothetical protein
LVWPAFLVYEVFCYIGGWMKIVNQTIHKEKILLKF